LLYQQHGGSGLNLTYEAIESFPIMDVYWFLEKLREVREYEASELKKASSSRG
jgi:hypothetical protein